MSLLNVYVIPAYYCHAEPSTKKGKITRQRLHTGYVSKKLDELVYYHASALHWNMKELSGENLKNLIEEVIKYYEKIEKETMVKMHSKNGLIGFMEKIEKGVDEFKRFSRIKAKEAQNREFVTTQPKERVNIEAKARITIENYLGGRYYFTVDETIADKDCLYLIEAKHSKSKPFPSYNDIKDGLLKMILYTNISTLKIDGRETKFKPALKLTSSMIKNFYKMGEITSFVSELGTQAKTFFADLIKEAKYNGFEVWLEGTDD